MITCSFTGHRIQRLGSKEIDDKKCIEIKNWLERTSEKLIIEKGVTRFISGMALGTDQWGALAILNLKKKYPNLLLEAAIPSRDFHESWSDKNKKQFMNILKQCDNIKYFANKYNLNNIYTRNRYLVDECQVLLAVWDTVPKGGTYRTITYGIKKNKSLIFLNPTEMTIGYRRGAKF
jgi:uncharacterized phage-like protein YoqJ